MLEPNANGLINGMTRPQYDEVRAFIRELTDAGWLYDLEHTVEVHRQNAEVKLADAARTFKGFNEPQRVWFLKNYSTVGISFGIAAQMVAAFGAAAYVTH